jgi:hypothetical protein
MLSVTNALYSHVTSLHFEINEGLAEEIEVCWMFFSVCDRHPIFGETDENS